jgi:hypothetical protein
MSVGAKTTSKNTTASSAAAAVTLTNVSAAAAGTESKKRKEKKKLSNAVAASSATATAAAAVRVHRHCYGSRERRGYPNSFELCVSSRICCFGSISFVAKALLCLCYYFCNCVMRCTAVLTKERRMVRKIDMGPKMNLAHFAQQLTSRDKDRSAALK